VHYRYIGGVDGDHFYEGLPAQDLESDHLSPEQQRLLDQAVAAGIYEGSSVASSPVDAAVSETQPEENEGSASQQW
jgi:hypothetical protein